MQSFWENCVKCTVVVLLFVHFGGAVVEDSARRQVRYEHFDDFLVGALTPINQKPRRPRLPPSRLRPGRLPRPTDPTDDEELSETGSGHSRDGNRPATSTSDLLDYFRDVPREHWSCCMLGKLAGNKGFHCHAPLYAARINRRNFNRSHNRRLPIHGRRSNPNYGRAMMGTFRRCVVNRSAHEFHKCCYAATIETREISRWQQTYRQQNMENESTVER